MNPSRPCLGRKSLLVPGTQDQTNTEAANKTLTPLRSFLKLFLMLYSIFSARGGSTKCPAPAQPVSLYLTQIQLCVPLPKMHLPSKKLYLGTLPGRWCLFQVCSWLKALAGSSMCSQSTYEDHRYQQQSLLLSCRWKQLLILPATAGHNGVFSSTSSAEDITLGGSLKPPV